MKKLILAISIIIIASCSKSDDEENRGYFLPPTWIQGVWKNDTSGELLTFTAHDIKYSTNNKNSISFSKEINKLSQGYPQQISSTPNLYIVDFSQGMPNSLIRFKFIKTSDKTLKSEGYLSGNYTKQ